MKKLYLGSTSINRRELLTQAQIPFELAVQNADESQCDWGLPFPQVLKTIAYHKMDHVVLPVSQEGDECFVLTADTMCLDKEGRIHGKPKNKEAARIMLQALSPRGKVGTAFCLTRKIYRNGAWYTQEKRDGYVETVYELDLSGLWIDRYLEATPEFASISGALRIDGYGAQFLQAIQGSYSSVLGLPLVELRQALEELGFFS